MIILNILITVWAWKVANDAFEIERNTVGWVCVAVSAMNGAVVLYRLTSGV